MKIAIVDPVSSGVYLGGKLKQYGIETTAIFTLKDLDAEQKRIGFHPEAFDYALMLDQETPVELAQQLKQAGVQYVLNGYEGSLHFTEQVTAILCPEFANDPSTSEYRTNKYLMQMALKQHGIPDVKQMLVYNKQLSSTDLLTLQQFTFPVIMKPVNGEASIGTLRCDSIDDIKNALLATKDWRLLNQVLIETYVIQELLIGEEYLVDTFSLKGEHHIAGIHKYGKTFFEGSPIYRFCESIGQDTEEWHVCAEFVKNTLTAVRLDNGFAHTEIFITAQGPRLVEVNPRISGAAGFTQMLNQRIYGVDQIDLLAKMLQIPLYSHENQPKTYTTGRISILQNWQAKTIKALDAKMLYSLESYQNHLFLKEAGMYLNIPKTLSDSVAYVLLAHESKEQLQKDYQQLMVWEEEGALF